MDMIIRLKVAPKDKQIICANCGQTGHYQNVCTSENPKCVNCGGAHKTLAAVCPVRKDLIKSRGKLVRDRSRSRSMARTSYASSISNNVSNNNNVPNVKFPQQQQQQSFTPPSAMDTKNTQDLVAKILTFIVAAHYAKSQQPGTFQETIDSMLVANNLPKVNFPQQIVTKTFNNLLHQLKDDIIDIISTSPENNVVQEIINVSDNIIEHSLRPTNDMETEQTEHGFKRALESSPEAPKMKREMATSSSGNVAVHTERPTPAPKPNNLSLSHPLPQHVPRAGRANENSRSRSTSRDSSHNQKSIKFVRSPSVNHNNTKEAQIVVYVAKVWGWI